MAIGQLVANTVAGDPMPPPQQGEHDVVLEMWSRLEHVTVMAQALRCMDGMPEATRQKAQQIADFADPNALYPRMQRVLAKADGNAYLREEELRREIGELWTENQRLRAELATRRG